jgi:DnaD/phage-associated family protein
VSPDSGEGADERVPASVLARLIRDTWQPLEVKVVLACAALGGLRVPVREGDLLLDEGLQQGIRADGSGREPADRAAEALELAVARGTVLRLADDEGEHWLLLGTEENTRRARTRRAAATPGAAWRGSLRLERPSIFTLYEQNIGLVTPIIADRLVEAIERYPESWIEEAIAEAVSYNRRSWRYIQRILENWATEGRTDETNRGDPARDRNRAKHLHGKYAHLFGRDRLPDL